MVKKFSSSQKELLIEELVEFLLGDLENLGLEELEAYSFDNYISCLIEAAERIRDNRLGEEMWDQVKVEK